MSTESKDKNGPESANDMSKGTKENDETKPKNQYRDALIAGAFVIIAAIITGVVGPIVIEKFKATPVPTAALTLCSDTNAINWNETAQHSGEIMTVVGPVVDASYNRSTAGEPTFLNIGKEFPDPDRFTVVIWGDNRPNFPTEPEKTYRGKEICVRGLIDEFQGSMQIEVDSPSQIEIK